MAAVKLLVATVSFWTQHDGQERLFLAGQTKVRADHPLVKGKELYFEPTDDADRRDEVRQ